jgi:hypothetical protein
MPSFTVSVMSGSDRRSLTLTLSIGATSKAGSRDAKLVVESVVVGIA